MIIGMNGSSKKNPSPWLSGLWYCKESLVKIPVIKEHGSSSILVLQGDYGNQVPDNQGIAVY